MGPLGSVTADGSVVADAREKKQKKKKKMNEMNDQDGRKCLCVRHEFNKKIPERAISKTKNRQSGRDKSSVPV